MRDVGKGPPTILTTKNSKHNVKGDPPESKEANQLTLSLRA